MTSEENGKALANLNDKFLEIANARGISASYLLSPVSKITNPEHTSQLELVRDPDSNRLIGLLINKTIPVFPYDNFFTFPCVNQKV